MFKLLNNLPIRKKMITSFIIVILLTLIGSLTGISSLMNIHDKSEWVYKYYGEAQGTVNYFEAEFKNNQLIMSKILTASSTVARNEYLEMLEESSKELNDTFAVLDELCLTAEAKEIISRLDNLSKEYEMQREDFIKQVKSGSLEEASKALLEKITPLGENISKVIEELIVNKQVKGQLQINNLEIIIIISGIIICATVVAAIIISMLLAVKISNGISKSANNMLEGMNRLAEGDLNVEVPVTSKDEIGTISDEFNSACSTLQSYVNDVNRSMSLIAQGDLTVKEKVVFKGDFLTMQNNIIKMLESQNGLLTNINQASNQVYAGSEQVADGSQSLASGANEQAGTIEELSDTISEISRQIDETAKNAELSSKMSNRAGSLLVAANEKMDGMKGSMEEINNSSKEISKIISVINNIATQTNLLALNASIEAARAGEAGKGFAVVADQVTVLAKQSADAAKESNQLIVKSVSAAEKGKLIATEMAEAMLLTMDNAKLAVESVEKISLAAQLQSEAIDQVTNGMKQISDVVQDNSSTAQECAAASEELTAQAEEMRRLVSRFKLRS